MRTLEKRWEISTAVLPLLSSLKRLEDLELGPRVERRGRLVEDQHLGLAHIGARDRHFLPFAARQLDAVLEAFADALAVAAGQPRRSPRRLGCAWAARSIRAWSSRASMRPTAMLSPAVKL
jgi:hypothetical protein